MEEVLLHEEGKEESDSFNYKALSQPDYSNTELKAAVNDLLDKYGISGVGRLIDMYESKTGELIDAFDRIVSVFTAGSCNKPAERTPESDVDVMVVFEDKKYLEEHINEIKETLEPYSKGNFKFWLYYKEQYTNPLEHFKPGIPVKEGHEDWGNLAKLAQLHWQAKKGLTYTGEEIIEDLHKKLYAQDDDFSVSLAIPVQEGYELLLPSSRQLFYGVMNEDGNKVAKAILGTMYALHILSNGEALGSYNEIFNQIGRLSRICNIGGYEELIELAYKIKKNPKEDSFEEFREKLPEIFDFFGTARRLAGREISANIHKFEKSRLDAIEEYFNRTVKEFEEKDILAELDDDELLEKGSALDFYVYDLLAFRKLPEKIKKFYEEFYKIFPGKDLREITGSDGWKEHILIKGKILSSVGKYKEAIALFEEFLKHKEPITTGYLGLVDKLNRAEVSKEAGTASLNIKDYSAAENYLKNSLKLDPTNPEVWTLLSRTVLSNNRDLSKEYNLIAETLEEIRDNKTKYSLFHLQAQLSPDTRREFFGILKNYLVNTIRSDRDLLEEERDENQNELENYEEKDRSCLELIEVYNAKDMCLEELIDVQKNILELAEVSGGESYFDILKSYTQENDRIRKNILLLNRKRDKILHKIIAGDISKEKVDFEKSASDPRRLKRKILSNKAPAAALAGSIAVETGVAYLLPALLIPASIIAAPILVASAALLLGNWLYK